MSSSRFSKSRDQLSRSLGGDIDSVCQAVYGKSPINTTSDRYLQSEPKPSLSSALKPLNAVIQSTSVDLLQAIIARGEVDQLSIEIVEATVISKLYYCIHTNRLDLQNKLLHLLHSLISASLSYLNSKKNKQANVGRQRTGDPFLEEAYPHDSVQDSAAGMYDINPLLIQTLVDGIATPSNRPVFQHWLDFVLMAVPQFQPALEVVIHPLNNCLCRQLLSALRDVRQASVEDPSGAEDVSSTTTDTEMIMFLNGLERLILLSLVHTSEPNPVEEDANVTEKTGQESSGLLGYVSNVFSSDSAITTTEDQLTVSHDGRQYLTTSLLTNSQMKARSPGYRALHEGVRVLFCIWDGMVWAQPQSRTSKDDSLSLIYNRTRLRCRRVLEHLFQVHSAEVFESIVDCWNREGSVRYNHLSIENG